MSCPRDGLRQIAVGGLVVALLVLMPPVKAAALGLVAIFVWGFICARRRT